MHDIKCIDNQLLYCIRVQQEAGEHSNSHIHFYSKHSKDGFQGVKKCTNKVHRYPCCFLHMMILPLAVLSPIIHQANGSYSVLYHIHTVTTCFLSMRPKHTQGLVDLFSMTRSLHADLATNPTLWICLSTPQNCQFLLDF